jgi:hypothetical protein
MQSTFVVTPQYTRPTSKPPLHSGQPSARLGGTLGHWPMQARVKAPGFIHPANSPIQTFGQKSANAHVQTFGQHTFGQSMQSKGQPVPVQSFGQPVPVQSFGQSFGQPVPAQSFGQSFGPAQSLRHSFGQPVPAQSLRQSFGQPVPAQSLRQSFGQPVQAPAQSLGHSFGQLAPPAPVHSFGQLAPAHEPVLPTIQPTHHQYEGETYLMMNNTELIIDNCLELQKRLLPTSL